MSDMALQELSERSWRGDPPSPLEALKGTGILLYCMNHPLQHMVALPAGHLQALPPLPISLLTGRALTIEEASFAVYMCPACRSLTLAQLSM